MLFKSLKYLKDSFFWTSRSTYNTSILFIGYLLSRGLNTSLFCFKVISHQTPIYLSEFHLYFPSQQLHSYAETKCSQYHPSTLSQSTRLLTTWNQLLVSVCHVASVSSFNSSLNSFEKNFFIPIALRYECVLCTLNLCGFGCRVFSQEKYAKELLFCSEECQWRCQKIGHLQLCTFCETFSCVCDDSWSRVY